MHETAQNKKEYKKHIDEALNNSYMRKTLDKFAVDYRENRISVMDEIPLREHISKIAEKKDWCSKNLDALYFQFKEEAKKRGIIVHRAKDALEANMYVSVIAQSKNAKKFIKSKSMTAEEIELNKFLYNDKDLSENIEIIETDLGEWIIQLRNEGPSHMVMPAIHLSRYEIANDFTKVTGHEYDPEDVHNLVKVARIQLRKHFHSADIGISGANFCIAENGSFGLVSNEGNAKMVSTLPKTHIIIAGLDKIVPTIEDALTAATVLPRNATAQRLTANLSFINGVTDFSSGTDSEKKEVHIIFVDNGRSEIAKDPLFSQIFRCVRCGACANVCPVYRMVGGHKMGYIYIGAIGLILTYFYHDKEKANYLSQNCLGCGACKDVCAGNIDLPRLIQEIRKLCQDEFGSPATAVLSAQIMKNRKLFHTLLKSVRFSQKPFIGKENYIRHLPDILFGKHQFKSLPSLASKSFRELWAEELQYTLPNPDKTIALFAGCVQDFIYPEQLKSFVKVMKKMNVQIDFPEEQNCCGLPLQMLSQNEIAKDVAMTNTNALRKTNYDAIVTLCASCASHMKHGYQNLLGDSFIHLYNKVYDFSTFMVDILQVKSDIFKKSDEKVAIHYPCHQCRTLGVNNQPVKLIELVANYTPTKEEKVCCGFGGTYSAKFPEISSELLSNKINDITSTTAQRIVMDCPGCVIQIKGGMHKSKHDIKVTHIAELLEENLID